MVYFYLKNLIQQPADFFRLESKSKHGSNLIEFLGKGWGEKSLQNLFHSIEKAKLINLDRFLFSLGIRHIGENAALILATYFGSWDDFYKEIKSGISKNDRQFLFEIQLPIKEDADTWILSGVAIFLAQA